MKSKQLCLFLFLSFASFCVQNTSKGAAMATNSTDGPQGQREVRTTAYARSRHYSRYPVFTDRAAAVLVGD